MKVSFQASFGLSTQIMEIEAKKACKFFLWESQFEIQGA